MRCAAWSLGYVSHYERGATRPLEVLSALASASAMQSTPAYASNTTARVASARAVYVVWRKRS